MSVEHDNITRTLLKLSSVALILKIRAGQFKFQAHLLPGLVSVNEIKVTGVRVM